MSKVTILSCLKTIKVNHDDIKDCGDIQAEFAVIKKVYFKGVLNAHPDKGGDVIIFRALQEAWETIRSIYDMGQVHVQGFAFYFSGNGSQSEIEKGVRNEAHDFDFEWYEAAAEEPVPPYRVEIAKSARSKYLFSYLKTITMLP